ncbi:MAG: DUF1893 domain-containing protein [Chloroflexota bacterium]
MKPPLFDDFLKSQDSLRVYENDRLIFASDKDRLIPLMEYLGKFGTSHKGLTLMDRIMGNAAALLTVKAGGVEVFSPLGSKLAVQTLTRFGVKYTLSEIAPVIQMPDGGMCPMEKLSLGKEPDEFYQIIKTMLKEHPATA